MLVDIMQAFKHKESNLFLTLLSHRKSIVDVCKKYSINDKVFFQVLVICNYCAENKTYTVDFNSHALIDLYTVITGQSTFNPKVMTDAGILQYTSGRYIINALAYEVFDYYVERLRINFQTQSKLLGRYSKIFSSLMLIDDVLFRYDKSHKLLGKYWKHRATK